MTVRFSSPEEQVKFLEKRVAELIVERSAQIAAAQPTLEASNRVVRAWRAYMTSGIGIWGGQRELVEALDALAGVVGDEETT